MNTIAFSDLSTPLQLGIGALAALQVLLWIISLVVLARMGAGKIVGMPRWLWAIIIVFGQIVGSLVFLLAARMERTTRKERQAFEKSTDDHTTTPVSDVITDLYRSGPA